MNQTMTPSAQKELKLQKTTIVKLNMSKVDRMIRNNFAGETTSASTAAACDVTTVTVTLVV